MRQELWLTGYAPVPVCLSCVNCLILTYLSSVCLLSACHLSVWLLTCLSVGLSRRLLSLLSDCNSAHSVVEDRQVSERLWVLFLSAVEYFLSDLKKAKDLIGQFPLTQRSNRRSLVNTGELLAPPPTCGSSVIG